MPLISPKVTCTCKACQGPITVKDATAGCSLCGYSMHYNCAVRNIDPFTPSQVGWFRRSYRINTFFHFGHQHITFCPACHQLLSRQFLPHMANRLELTARYDELAQLYEDFGLLAEAGAVRNRKNKQVVKNINVDVNDLVNQMRSGTLSIPYKCTNCGASLTMTNSGEGMKFCSYCGTAINTEALLAVIQQALK